MQNLNRKRSPKPLWSVAILLTAGAMSLLADSTTEQVASRPTAAPPGAYITNDGWVAPIQPPVEKPTLDAEITKVFILPIREEIQQKTFDALKRKVIRCRASGAELIVLDMDTYGGGVGPALDIARLIKQDLNDIYTVCYVRPNGISAGALIALACDQIVMTPTGKLGDAAPILMGSELKDVEREKIESALRAEFRESAERNGYPIALAESMVSWDLEVWQIRHKTTQELRYVEKEEYQGRVEIPAGVTTGPSATQSDWELLRVIIPSGKLLTMTPTQAREYGFAAALLPAPAEDPYQNLLAHYHITGQPVILKDTWSEKLVGFLSSSKVVGLLFFAGLLCGYIEMQTPGFGVAGTIAIVCFAILFGSRFLVGMAAWWEIAIFAVGLILLGLEIFVIPGFGIAGILGILFCVAGLLAMLVSNPPDKLPIPKTDLDWSIFVNGITAMMAGFVLACLAAIVIARFLPKTPVAGRLILAGPNIQPTSPADDKAPIHSIKVGDIGTVHGPCRPVGQIQLGDNLLDAMTEGEFIPTGTKVKVVKVEGNRVVITPVT